MSRIAGPYPLSAGVELDKALPGPQSALMAVRFYNFSPFTLSIVAAGNSFHVAPMTRDIFFPPVAANWDGSFAATPILDLPSFLVPLAPNILRVVTYGAGEQIPGDDPASLIYSLGANLSGPFTIPSLELTGTDNWVITQDGLGNLTFTDLATSEVFVMKRTGAMTIPGALSVVGSYTLTGVDTWTVSEDGSGNLLITDTTTGQVYTLGRAGAHTWTGSLTVNSSGTTAPTLFTLSGVPAVDTAVVRAQVAGDTVARSQMYLTGPAGAGGLRAGLGSSILATLFAQANGWTMGQGLLIQGATGLSLSAGPVAQVNGISTVGNGVPLAIAQALRVSVTTTLLQTLITIVTPPVGLYEFSGTITGKAAGSVTVTVGWNDPDSIAQSTNPVSISNGTGTPVASVVGMTIANNLVIPMATFAFEAGPGGNIVVSFQDVHASPHDVVSVQIRQLA